MYDEVVEREAATGRSAGCRAAAGVALGQPDPKPYLREGDVVEVEIDGLGRQRQEVGQA